MNSASLCSLAGRYDNPLPPRFLAPIAALKIPAQDSTQQKQAIPFSAIISAAEIDRYSKYFVIANIFQCFWQVEHRPPIPCKQNLDITNLSRSSISKSGTKLKNSCSEKKVECNFTHG
jgi:hypothetical protein